VTFSFGTLKLNVTPDEFKRDTSLSIAKNAMEPVRISVTTLMDLGGAHMKVYAGIDLHSSNNYVGVIYELKVNRFY
jgi:hypothetical protein